MSDEFTEKEISKVRQQVLDCLAKDVRCRNDDKWLTWKVMRLYTDIYIPFDDFSALPSFETIRRTRAKIQNKEGLFLPTDDDVIKKRRMRRSVFSSWAVRGGSE